MRSRMCRSVRKCCPSHGRRRRGTATPSDFLDQEGPIVAGRGAAGERGEVGEDRLEHFLGCPAAQRSDVVQHTLLAETEAAVRRAEAAGAGERAPDLLAKARRAWDEGRLASGEAQGTTAIRRLEEAREYARAAEAAANAGRMRNEAESLKQQADELEARTRQIRSAPTP